MVTMLFKFTGVNSYNEWNVGDIATFLAMTYQPEVGPVVWLITRDGRIVGANPNCLLKVDEDSVWTAGKNKA